jgi:hypothetical protein
MNFILSAFNSVVGFKPFVQTTKDTVHAIMRTVFGCEGMLLVSSAKSTHRDLFPSFVALLLPESYCFQR